jgi:hypothetical protein
VYAVYEHVVCVIYVTYAEVLQASLVVWYMDDKYEESYEVCLYW